MDANMKKEIRPRSCGEVNRADKRSLRRIRCRKRRKLMPGAEPWLRALRRVAILCRVLSFAGVILLGLALEPTLRGALMAVILAGVNYIWTEIHEGANELLGMGEYYEH